jgi:hypothetical protein
LWIPEVFRVKGCCLVTFLLQLLSDPMLCAKNINKKELPQKTSLIIILDFTKEEKS